MTTLTIKDLPFADEMDHTEMANVSGGLPQQILDTIQFVHDYTHGLCDTSDSGKSIVCYP